MLNCISDLHDLYCQLTGLNLRYTPMEHDSDWYLWSKDFGSDDLELVVPWLKRHYAKKPDILKSTLMFRHLIRCKDYFREYLAQAQADARKPKRTDRDSVLAATGRTEPKPDNTKTPAQILRGSSVLPTQNEVNASTTPAAPQPNKFWEAQHEKLKQMVVQWEIEQGIRPKQT